MNGEELVNNPDELYHYGVLGMKWGVRRYQNTDGSLTKAGKNRLKAYKQVENRRIDKKYKIDKLDRKRSKLEKKYKDDHSDKTNAKIQQALYRQLRNESMRFMEREAVKNMNWDDMKKEKAAVRKDAVKRLIKAGVVSSSITPYDDQTYVIFRMTNSTKVKTDRRVSGDKKLEIDYEARQATGYTGNWVKY